MTSSKPTADTTFVELPPASLEELARLDVTRLDQLYRRGRAPESLEELDGSLDGRLLGFGGVLSPFDEPLRQLTSQPWFFWRGKVFGASVSRRAAFGRRGEGANRLWLLGEHQMFPFDTSITTSVLDERPCVLIDYDRPDNPSLVRLVRDELRQVRPGLFIGPSFLRVGNVPRLWLYFGVESRDTSGQQYERR